MKFQKIKVEIYDSLRTMWQLSQIAGKFFCTAGRENNRTMAKTIDISTKK